MTTVATQVVNKQFYSQLREWSPFKIVSAHVFNIPTLVEGYGCSP
jgi:hypothetical protein